MAMTPDEQGIFYVLIVGGGPGAGEFTYDASGNLRSANVGQVTTDPVQGITCQQGFSTFNGHGAVINLLSTSKGAFFQYQDLGTSSQGTMILAVASAGGTDPVTGFVYQAGMTGVDPVFGDSIITVGATINLAQVAFTANSQVTANTGSGATSPFIGVTGPEQGHAGHAVLRVLGVSADGTVPQGVIISGTDPPVRQAATLLEIQGTAALINTSQPAQAIAGPVVWANNGRPNVVDGSDGNNYNMSVLPLRATAVPQTITSTTATTITGCSAPVSARRYAFRARVHFHGGSAAGTANFSVTGPANTGPWIGAQFIMATSNSALASVQNAALGPVNSATLTTAASSIAEIEGEVTFTAAGTIALAVAEGTSGDTVIIDQAKFWLYPI